ncbi:hypothetical protein O7632_16335 [Solwaraspora sp. WMMD406]|uniref:hypothetical protein n=1 Tax=Solwaraspora sp. WMMD406 TaxID=3016095 RepID=UPI002415EFAB|nr:hypothetical protein [Solwaraspora sp. WMMD406]MDG4765655.1 hypothetical protein [Solwaraspora sp. WMMD406]
MLIPGITLNVLSDVHESTDIAISSGTRSLADCANVPAAASAIVPRDDWRPLTTAEFDLLRPTPDTQLHEMLTLIDLDPAALTDIQQRMLPLLADPADTPADAERRTATVRAARDLLLDTLYQRAGITCGDHGPADTVVHSPQQLSTAYNYAERVFMGLHLDNHQDYPLTERHLSYLLAGVNLGFAHRYVHFVNLRVVDLIRLLRETGHPVPITTHALKNAFFAAFGGYPVVRIRLRPGQAYVVNTQDVLHDGATNDVGLPDVSMLTANALSARAMAPSPAG